VYGSIHYFLHTTGNSLNIFILRCVWYYSHIHLLFIFLRKFTFESVEPTCRSNKFNGEFAHLLYKDGQEMCRKMKSTISIFILHAVYCKSA
jgi:hypothetical protein